MESALPETSPRRRQLGRYVLGRRIGAGGMAAVFAARQTGPLGLGRLVALKVMSTALLGDPELERLFVREAGISARLQHDNIVRVYEVDETEATYFIAMELVLGATLRETGHALRPPVAVALAIVLQVADALHYAHELRSPAGEPLGIVHQDVTPHNVMVTYRGVVKLLDFGVARIGHLDASRTETIRGKPAYLAPEQLSGERIDRRTDIFALGIVLHELLSGCRLFHSKSDLGTYEAVMSKPIPPLEDVPAGIDAVCRRALARNPADRFEHAEALSRALLEAANTSDTSIASREELAAWVAQASPPRWSLEELERETLESESRQERLDAVQDLPTRSAVAAPSEAATVVEGQEKKPGRARLALFALGALGLGGALSYATLGRAPAVTRARVGISQSPPPLPPRSLAPRVSPTSEAALAPSNAQPRSRASAASKPPPRVALRPHAKVAPPKAAPPKVTQPPEPPLPPAPPPRDHGIPSVRD